MGTVILIGIVVSFVTVLIMAFSDSDSNVIFIVLGVFFACCVMGMFCLVFNSTSPSDEVTPPTSLVSSISSDYYGCPYCNEKLIYNRQSNEDKILDIEGGTIWRNFTCPSCEAHFKILFEYSNVNIGNIIEVVKE